MSHFFPKYFVIALECPHIELMELTPVTVLSALRTYLTFLFCRLRQLDKHGQATAQQLVQLLNKQNQLLLERQNLSEEVDQLRAQLPSMPQSDC